MNDARQQALPPEEPPAETPRETKEAKTIMVLVVLAMLLFAIAESIQWYTMAERLDAFSEMARLIFTIYIIPFEMLGFLLLAALLGALFIAMREGRRDD